MAVFSGERLARRERRFQNLVLCRPKRRFRSSPSASHREALAFCSQTVFLTFSFPDAPYQYVGQEEVCVFLRELLRHLRGPVIVLLDNSSTHQGKPLKHLLQQHPRLHIEHFPCYAPELNPDEGVWSLAKRTLANSCPNDLEELVEDVIYSINGIRTTTQKLRGCIAQSELPSFLR